MNLASTIERKLSPTLRAASVRLTRQLSASPEHIFDAWLHPEVARCFLFAAGGGDAISAAADVRIGGSFRIVRRSDAAAVEYCGQYLEIERPQRLVLSLFVERYAQRDDRVIVELAPLAQRSLLVLTHEFSLPDPLHRSRLQRSWALALERLDALCTVGAKLSPAALSFTGIVASECLPTRNMLRPRSAVIPSDFNLTS
jgi:uncharacterized protein YndB with AHSA1/START domain